MQMRESSTSELSMAEATTSRESTTKTETEFFNLVV